MYDIHYVFVGVLLYVCWVGGCVVSSVWVKSIIILLIFDKNKGGVVVYVHERRMWQKGGRINEVGDEQKGDGSVIRWLFRIDDILLHTWS